MTDTTTIPSDPLTLAHLEELRVCVGMKIGRHNTDRLQELIAWGYITSEGLHLTPKGSAALGRHGAWSPDHDPRTDR